MKKRIDCVLLIDDNADDNTYNQIIIEKTDAVDQVVIAENGEDALRVLTEQSDQVPELILLDLNMPKMNGWEFLEAYKALYPERNSPAKVVVLATALSDDDLKKLNTIPWISSSNIKPLTTTMLTNILEHYLKKNHPGYQPLENDPPEHDQMTSKPAMR